MEPVEDRDDGERQADERREEPKPAPPAPSPEYVPVGPDAPQFWWSGYGPFTF